MKGRQFKPSNKERNEGFYATRIAYDEVNGVTPVATMLQYRFKAGTMIVSGITLTDVSDGLRVWRPIIGGTGDFAGANGEVSSVGQPSGLWLKTGRIWR